MLAPGQKIGNYEIIRTLGAGGMGVVYEARHGVLGTRAALKLLLPNLAASEKVRTRFVQEGYIQHELQHPNIVRVLDAIDTDGWLGLALEFVDGPSLEDMVAARVGPWPADATIATLAAVAGAMAYAHARGVVHRDLKPGNILVPAPGGHPDLASARVTDFGIARVLSTEARMTRTNAQMGTMPYMAPEQYKGAQNADARADVFALGMIGWRLVTGTLPVDGSDMSAVHELYIGARAIPPVRALNPTVPDALGQAIDACLRLDPQVRPADASVVRQALAPMVPADASWSGSFANTGHGVGTPIPDRVTGPVSQPPVSHPPITLLPSTPRAGASGPSTAAPTVFEQAPASAIADPAPRASRGFPVAAAVAAVAILLGVGVGATMFGRGDSAEAVEAEAPDEAAAQPKEPEAAPEPEPPAQIRNVGLGGACESSQQCTVGTCLNRACTLGFASSVWQPGNRWVFRKSSNDPRNETNTYDYRYVRQLRAAIPQVDGSLRLEFDIVGGKDANDSETYVVRDTCMYSQGRRDQTLLWCLPTGSHAWSWADFHGNPTAVAAFMSDTEYQTRISPEFGWVHFTRRWTTGRVQTFDVVGYRVGGVAGGDADAVPPTCDWDDHDTRPSDADFVWRPRSQWDRVYSQALGGIRWAREVHVDTRSGVWPERFYAVSDANRTYLPIGNNFQLASVEGPVADLGAWLDPATGIEHVVLVTGGPGTWRLHHMTSRSVHPRSWRVNATVDELEPDPFPTMTGCILRVAADYDETGQVADFDVSSGELRRIGGSLGVF